jgi:phenylacetaldehyde dehydrogenase
METWYGLLASITAASGQNSRTIFQPAKGGAVGEAPIHDLEYLEPVVAPAAAAQPTWAEHGHDGRSAALLKAADAVERFAEELASFSRRPSSVASLRHTRWQ